MERLNPLKILKELDLDMSTLPGRYRFALMVLTFSEQAQRIGHPIQPQNLAGVRPRDIKRIMKKSSLSGEDVFTLREFRKWRDEVFRIEGINGLNFRADVRAIESFDERLAGPASVAEAFGGYDEIEVKRETMAFWFKNEYEVYQLRLWSENDQ